MFYPYVTISAAQARESGDLRHAMSPFSLFLSSFSDAQRILGYARPRSIAVVHPPKWEKRRSIWRSLRAALWRNWPSNAALKDAESELRHSNSLTSSFQKVKGQLHCCIITFRTGDGDGTPRVVASWISDTRDGLCCWASCGRRVWGIRVCRICSFWSTFEHCSRPHADRAHWYRSSGECGCTMWWHCRKTFSLLWTGELLL